MKKLIVHEIEFDNSIYWTETWRYPQKGLFLVRWNPELPDKALVYNDGISALWFGVVPEECFEQEFKSEQESMELPKRWVSERSMISEDFALQMLSVALHKQKI